ncbi:MAG: FliM/FliN family flagellar motor C-terminal domain-containing protein [Acidobacteriia bacterium]|nr:FliM/FliN family flagellar motor C-terminal domain-containing protein [Terriglobia bacterium]
MAAAVQPTLEAPSADPFAERWPRVEALPCLLTVEIPLPGFTVADLLHLERGRIIASRWTVGQDVPLRINHELIAWSEFEVVQNHLAVRLTELA